MRVPGVDRTSKLWNILSALRKVLHTSEQRLHHQIEHGDFTRIKTSTKYNKKTLMNPPQEVKYFSILHMPGQAGRVENSVSESSSQSSVEYNFP